MTTVSAIAPTPAVQAEISPPVLQPGAVIDARVVQMLDNGLARIAIAGAMIDVMAAADISAGDVLRLAVSETAQGIRLAVVGQVHPQGGNDASAPGGVPQASTNGAVVAPDNSATGRSGPAGSVATSASAVRATAEPRTAEAVSLTPAQQAVAQATQNAAPRQASLAPLFANVAAALGAKTLPPQVQQAALQLLALRPALNENLTPQDLRNAFQRSGLFLESTLAAGGLPAGQAGAVPDLKAALVVLRQVLGNWSAALDAETVASGAGSPPVLPSDMAPQSSRAASAPSPAPVQPSAGEMPGQETATVPGGLPGAGSTRIADPKTIAITVSQRSTGASPASSPVPSDIAQTPAGASRSAAANAAQTASDLDDKEGLLRLVGASAASARNAAGAVSTPASRAAASEALAVLMAQTEQDAPPDILAAHHDFPLRAGPHQPPAPPFRGAAPATQPIAQPDIASDAPPMAIARHLTEDVDGALARQTLLQAASLPDGAAGASRTDASGPQWHFEIPFATPQGTAMAQFEISRDGHHGGTEAATPVWQARFTVTVEPAGPVHAQVVLSGARTSVRMWAERPATTASLRANTAMLSSALREAELEPGDIVIGEGAPPAPKTPAAGRFLDRAS